MKFDKATFLYTQFSQYHFHFIKAQKFDWSCDHFQQSNLSMLKNQNAMLEVHTMNLNSSICCE